MRILHTSDWHVGRGIRGRSRADEHRAVLNGIAVVAADRGVDLALVTGDLFDSATPSPEAEQIVYRALLDLVDTGAQVVVVAGNHDNWRRLEAVKPLLGLTRVYVGARLARPQDGGVVELEAGGQRARIALLPWLSQRRIVRADDLMGLDADEHAGQYAGRVQLIIDRLCQRFTADTVNLVAAHLMVAGGVPGGGERRVHLFDDYVVPALAFPPTCHYVALGHLHRPQIIPGRCPIRYCGSPLQLDFGEEGDATQVLIVDADPNTPAEVEEVGVTGGRRLRTLRGSLAELTTLADNRPDRVGDLDEAYLRVEVTGPRPAGLADTVRELFPTAVDVLVADPEDRADPRDVDLDRVRGSPPELFDEYLTDHGIDDDRVRALFRDLLEECYAPDPP